MNLSSMNLTSGVSALDDAVTRGKGSWMTSLLPSAYRNNATSRIAFAQELALVKSCGAAGLHSGAAATAPAQGFAGNLFRCSRMQWMGGF